MKQHYLTLRANTHIGHGLPEESYDRMMLYLRNIIRLRRDNKINDPYLMLNADDKNNHVINKNIFIGMNKNSWTAIGIINKLERIYKLKSWM